MGPTEDGQILNATMLAVDDSSERLTLVRFHYNIVTARGGDDARSRWRR